VSTLHASRQRWATALLLGLLAGCGSSSSTRTATTSESARTQRDPAIVVVRGVEQQVPAPCPTPPTGRLAQLSPDDPSQCLVLGPAVVDATHVAESRLVVPDGVHVQVIVALNSEGTQAFNRLAAAQYDAGKDIAILVRGQVTSVAPVLEREYHGEIAVSGLDLDQARELVEALGGDTTVPTTAPPSEAEQLCDSRRPPAVGDLGVTFVVESIAQLVASELRASGADPHPWDQLPPDHLVVRCGYGAPAGDSTTPVLITGCYQYYLDADGRSTEIAPPSSECS
jgi:hypothetical protein